MLLSIEELVAIIVTTFAAGYIFMDAFKRPGWEHEIFGKRLMFSVMIAAPGIILHEFGHKFVALAYGLQATFHAAYTWLGAGILLKLIGFPFLIIVPAYVSIIGASSSQSAIIAFSGPAVNGLLWLGAWIALKLRRYSRTTEAVLYYTQTINMFLFIFNLIPIPGFDGWTFWMNVF